MSASYEVVEMDEGVLIRVDAEEAAVVVLDDAGERIYLPQNDVESVSSYYVSDRKSLTGENCLEVFHSGIPEDIKIFSKTEM